MLKNILPPRFFNALQQIDLSQVNEIRLRANRPTMVWTSCCFYLCNKGITSNEAESLISTNKELADIVFNACEHSVFAHNDELCNGFLTLNNGMRLGIAGQVVVEKGIIKTIKNFSSINIRFAREVKNFSLNCLPYICKPNVSGIYNTLVIAPPNSGKTTFIRDFCYQMSQQNIAKNVLIIDERNEITASTNGNPLLNVGKNSDIFCGCTKQFGIINGIRTMSPDVIVLDEIATIDDIKALNYVMSSGVSIVATVHAPNYEMLIKKPLFAEMFKMGLFERFVVLERVDGVCRVSMIHNQSGVCLFSGA